ncbi:MAG: TIGR01459 family HAD-type hydrolase [Rhodobacteraceae bacterium]|nr:TIGR01459 family HAD-type hydrolase [Paracoccaceae bacterium]
MTVQISSLGEVADRFDVAVLDQFGVLHDGRRPFPEVNHALEWLRRTNKGLVILSNSGKRADLNRARIGSLGLDLRQDDHVVTSGEVCWHDLDSGVFVVSKNGPQRLFAIAGREGDAETWASGNRGVELVFDLESADAVLLMGVPGEGSAGNAENVLTQALDRDIPLVCSNPDRSRYLDGRIAPATGSLADTYSDRGGRVSWYGKPHGAVFDAVCSIFPDISRKRILMVGDSLEHDVAGARKAGLATAFVYGGIHASEFAGLTEGESIAERLEHLVGTFSGSEPDFALPILT